MQIEDRYLVGQCKRGNRDALRRIYEKYRDPLLVTAFALSHDAHLAEDAVQDTFVLFAQNVMEFRLTGSLRAYLATCVTNRIRDLLRAKRRSLGYRPGTPSAESVEPGQTIAVNEELEQLSGALARLPDEQREVIVLHVHGDMRFRSIAAMQDTSLNTIKGRYPRRLTWGELEQEIRDATQIQRAVATPTASHDKDRYDRILEAASFFHTVVERSPDFGYYGQRVTARDGNRVLMYWNSPGAEYQVIWGDLHLEILTKDQLIQRCHAVGDSECLLDFLEKDNGTRTLVLAEYLGRIADPPAIPVLLKHADLWPGVSASNPFPKAVEAIRQRAEAQDPSATQVAGRLLYANGRAVNHGFIRIGTESEATDDNGYFTLRVPYDDPQTEYLGYAQQRPGTSARLFLWKKASQPGYPSIALEWVSFVHGRVVDQDGVPQSNVSVGLCPHGRMQAGRNWPAGNQTKTDTQGRFEFEKVPVGLPLDVVIENPNQPGMPVRIQIDHLAPDHKWDVRDVLVKRP